MMIPRTATACQFALLLFASFPSHAWDDERVIDETFVSPNGMYAIRFEGSYRGEGAYFLKTESGESEILRRYVHYGPQLTWISDEIAELTFGCGSPCWEGYYYDAAERQLSPEYSMPLAASASGRLVVSIEDDGLAVREMISGRTLATHEMDTGAWAGLLVFCDPHFHFQSYREFRYSYSCGDATFGPYAPGNASHVIHIPSAQ